MRRYVVEMIPAPGVIARHPRASFKPSTYSFSTRQDRLVRDMSKHGLPTLIFTSNLKALPPTSASHPTSLQGITSQCCRTSSVRHGGHHGRFGCFPLPDWAAGDHRISLLDSHLPLVFPSVGRSSRAQDMCINGTLRVLVGLPHGRTVFPQGARDARQIRQESSCPTRYRQ